MGFNNGLERIRLENQWKKLRVQYRAAGMSDEAIQAMYEFDFQVVNSEQTYYRHTVDLSISNTEAGDSRDTKHYHEVILTKLRSRPIVWWNRKSWSLPSFKLNRSSPSTRAVSKILQDTSPRKK